MRAFKFLLLVVVFGACGQARAEGGIVSLVKKVGTMIDSMSVKGVDRRYIDAPEKPWQLILKKQCEPDHREHAHAGEYVWGGI